MIGKSLQVHSLIVVLNFLLVCVATTTAAAPGTLASIAVDASENMVLSAPPGQAISLSAGVVLVNCVARMCSRCYQLFQRNTPSYRRR